MIGQNIAHYHMLGGVVLFGVIGVALIVAPEKQSGERASAAGA
ncbi:MAG TPA: hypothetical protein VEV41_26135 [Terriglobales bacterium]|nr:hypothetical protein [Terriglobales bacterium]